MDNLANVIISVSSLITALGVIIGGFWAVHKFLNKPQESRDDYMNYKKDTDKRMDKFENELQEIKSNQNLEAKCLFAILDILVETNKDCSAKVRDTRAELEKHLLEKAF